MYTAPFAGRSSTSRTRPSQSGFYPLDDGQRSARPRHDLLGPKERPPPTLNSFEVRLPVEQDFIESQAEEEERAEEKEDGEEEGAQEEQLSNSEDEEAD